MSIIIKIKVNDLILFRQNEENEFDKINLNDKNKLLSFTRLFNDIELSITTTPLYVSEIFSTSNLETSTFKSLINDFDKKNDQLILSENIHSPAPPEIYPPAENIVLTNTILPPSINPEPPGFFPTLTTTQQTLKNTLNLCKFKILKQTKNNFFY